MARFRDVSRPLFEGTISTFRWQTKTQSTKFCKGGAGIVNPRIEYLFFLSPCNYSHSAGDKLFTPSRPEPLLYWLAPNTESGLFIQFTGPETASLLPNVELSLLRREGEEPSRQCSLRSRRNFACRRSLPAKNATAPLWNNITWGGYAR